MSENNNNGGLVANTNHIIIDRRKNSKGRTIKSRRKFIHKFRKHVKRAVKDSIVDDNIQDITSDKGRRVKVPKKELEEANIRNGKGGEYDFVLPGNDQYDVGDRIKKPEGGQGGGGSGGSPDGEGEDDFTFHMSREEFLEFFFADLGLPDLSKTSVEAVLEEKWRKAGYASEGSPANLDVVRSLKKSMGRKAALKAPKMKKIRELEAELALLEALLEQGNTDPELPIKIQALKDEISSLRRQADSIHFIEEHDLQFRQRQKYTVPTTQAVMYCLMDVSISMQEWEKDMSKRFFMLLYLWLTTQYDQVEIRYCRHHTEATLCDQEEFFYAKETGGTMISPAVEAIRKDILEHFTTGWNVYVAQTSDGDNYSNDNASLRDEIAMILPYLQYYAYIEVNKRENPYGIWDMYQEIQAVNHNFRTAKIHDVTDIRGVFSDLFKKKA